MPRSSSIPPQTRRLLSLWTLSRIPATSSFLHPPLHSDHTVARPSAPLSLGCAPNRHSNDDDNDAAIANLMNNNRYYESDNNNQEQIPNDLGLDIIRGGGGDLSEDTWREIQEGAPGKFEIVKNMMGINIFTYILAILIAFFLSMNAIYGPGWLGKSMGWQDVGTFTKVSDSLPLDVDVSGEEFLL